MVEVMLVNAVSFLFRMACASISAGVRIVARTRSPLRGGGLIR